MNVLVTGCAGFIGSHLCHRLLQEGFFVTGIDSLIEYYSVTIKRKNLQSLIETKNFKFHQVDVLDFDFENENPEVLFHLAAQPGVRTSWGDDFSIYTRNNVLATQHLLEKAMHLNNLQKFVFASSSSVYGQTSAEKVTEDYPTKPFSPYGVTKLAAENLCSAYEENFGLPMVALRFFTVYGPQQRPDMAFNRLIKAAFSGEPFTLFGDGSQERDFTYIDDIVDGLLLAATSRDASGVFNIGGGHVVSMNDVIQLVEKISKRTINIVKNPEQKGDVKRTSADISKISKRLGYSPQVNIQEGLERQIMSDKG